MEVPITMIKITNLKKRFGDLCAVSDLSFQVNPGEVLGFLGPNGAGKSTTMKMLTGFLSPSSGDISIFGINVASKPLEAQRLIGYLPEGAPSYGDMTVLSFLKFIAAVRGYRGSDVDARVESVINKIQLEKVLYQRIETLSKGFKRRVGLAQAIIHDPKVLILDEPTDGLDPNQKHQVRELIKNLSKDKIVIISTHILEEVHAVCTRALIISSGTIVADGSPDQLSAMSKYHQAVSLKLSQPCDAVSALKALADVDSVAVGEEPNSYVVFPVPGKSILKAVNQLLHDRDWQVEELHVEKGRLDDVFRQVTLSSAHGQSQYKLDQSVKAEESEGVV